jgi:CheY-like chemotaxis protein
MKALSLRAHEKNLELACHVLADVPDALQGDPTRLRQIVLNLGGNAIKFTSQGEVVIRVETEEETEEEALHFAVQDTGAGIPAEKQRSIFDAFSQASRRQLRVLFAEDNAVNQKLAVRLLEKRGHTVFIAETGRAALGTLETESFDLIMMDVQMPEMDGIEATEAIREHEKTTGKHIPMIAMTANAMMGDKERCLAAGMDAYVSKPIQIKELLAVIESFLPAVPEISSV